MTVILAPIAPTSNVGSAQQQRPEEARKTTGVAALLRRELDRVDGAIRNANTATLKTASDELKVQAHLALLEAHDRLGVLESFGRGPSARLKDALHTAVDTGALQLALANMDLEDAVEARRKRAEQEFRMTRGAARDAFAEMWRDLEPRYRAFVKDVAKYI